VTRLEAVARCPWQAFLQRVLRLEPLPDARVALPSLGLHVIGNVLHGVLERIVAAAGAPAGAPLDPAGPVHDVPWPPPAELGALLEAEARRAVREEGIALPGLARVLAARVAPYLEEVRRLDWPEGVRRGVLGAELVGAARLVDDTGRARSVPFRADRADRGARALELTDYKSGKPAHEGVKGEPKRLEKLVAKVGPGEWLQAAAYAHAALPGGAVGRYLFANPATPGGAGPQAVSQDAPGVAGAFASSVRALLRLADARAFIPRLLDAGQVPIRCREWCEVSEACSQHDTASRHRLADWSDDARAQDTARLSDAERAALGVWWLGREEAP
jgi:hypothetical protein